MMNRFIFLALFLFSLYHLSAQEDTISKRLNHSLGVSAGSTTGLGFSYRFLPNKWGVQITGVPVFEQYRNVFSAGLTALYRLREHEKMDVFLYLGNHILFEKPKNLYPGSQGTWEPSTYSQYNAGLGAGVNINIADYLDLSLQLGYGVYNILQSNYINSNIAGGIGLYYRF